MSFQKSKSFFWISALFAALLPGCQKEEIAVYEVKRIQPPPGAITGPMQTLGGIFQREDSTWFFKLMGPITAVEKHRDGFNQFIHSVEFSQPAATPPVKWVTPANWKTGPSSDLRFASFVLEDIPKLELTVIKLGKEAGGLLANINRWRDQVGLPPIAEIDLPRVTVKEKINGVEAILVDLSGPGKKGGAAMPPFAKSAPPLPKQNNKENQPGNIDFRKPSEWQQIANAPLSLATFRVQDGTGKMDVTVTPLTGRAGGLGENVNRWRGQLGLPPWNAADLAKNTTKIAAGNLSAQMVDLESPSGPGQERVLGAIIETETDTWFIKARGPAELLLRQKNNFEQFVGSLKFEGKP